MLVPRPPLSLMTTVRSSAVARALVVVGQRVGVGQRRRPARSPTPRAPPPRRRAAARSSARTSRRRRRRPRRRASSAGLPAAARRSPRGPYPRRLRRTFRARDSRKGACAFVTLRSAEAPHPAQSPVNAVPAARARCAACTLNSASMRGIRGGRSARNRALRAVPTRSPVGYEAHVRPRSRAARQPITRDAVRRGRAAR